MIEVVVVALVCAQSPAPPVEEAARRKLLVMDLRVDAVDEASARTVQSALVAEIARIPALDVVSGDDVRRLVELETDRQTAGCELEGECLAEIADAMGAELVVFGDIGKLGALTLVHLSLLDARQSTPIARVEARAESVAGLPTALMDVLPTLFASALPAPALDAYKKDIQTRRTATIKLAARKGPPLYVIDPKLVNMAASVGVTVSSTLAKAAEGEGLSVFTRDDAKAIIARQADLAELNADADGASLGALGKKVGVDHVLACVVSAVDEDIIVQARLIDVTKAAVVSRREARASRFDGELVRTVEAAARLVLAPIFADQKGALKLVVSEEGATVKIDDETVGVTPLEREQIEMTGGTHMIEIEKDGFVRWAQTVRVNRGGVIDRDVVLVPSQEFVDDYRRFNGAVRAAAWGATAVTVAGLATTVGTWIGYGLSSQQLDATYRRSQAAVDATTVGTPEHEKALSDGERANNSARANTLGWFWGATVASIVTGIGLVGATGAWLFGDDPGRYDELVE